MNHENTIPADLGGLAFLAGELTRMEAAVQRLDDDARATAHAYREAIDGLHAESLRRLVRALHSCPEAGPALRKAAEDDVVYAVLRYHGIVKPTIFERVQAALDEVRPMLASHGGDVELIAVEPPVVSVSLVGACGSCPASTLTLESAVKTAVQTACPEIERIVQCRNGGRAASVDMALPDGIAWLPAGMLHEIPQGGIRALTLDDRDLILFRDGDVVACYDDRCTHLGGTLRKGRVEDGVIACPSHGFRFDLRSGECRTAPGMTLIAHEARVVAGRILVQIERR